MGEHYNFSFTVFTAFFSPTPPSHISSIFKFNYFYFSITLKSVPFLHSHFLVAIILYLDHSSLQMGTHSTLHLSSAFSRFATVPKVKTKIVNVAHSLAKTAFFASCSSSFCFLLFLHQLHWLFSQALELTILFPDTGPLHMLFLHLEWKPLYFILYKHLGPA